MADKKSVKGTAARLSGEDRKRALESALIKIEKDFGKGAVMRLGDQASRMQVEVIPTAAASTASAREVYCSTPSAVVTSATIISSREPTSPLAFCT